MAAIVSLGSIWSIFLLCMESKALEKSTNNIVASRFFTHTPSRIWKPFWLFLSIFSILGSMRLHSRAFVDLGRYGCKGYTSVVLGYSEVTLLREKEDASLCPSIYYVLVIYGIRVLEQYVIEFPGLPYFWGYFIKPCCFSILKFFLYWVEFFLHKLSLFDV